MLFQPTLNSAQAEFLSLDTKYRAFIAGYGSGKSWCGCCALAMHFWEHPGVDAGYFAPTYPQIRDIFYPTVSECFEQWGLDVEIRRSTSDVVVFGGGGRRGLIRCRSMDKPESIIGFKIGHALVDEIDVMPERKAVESWRKIIARMRYSQPGLKNGIDVTTTPEGFRFAYNTFVKQPREHPELARLYGLVRASTYDNADNLPEDYIPSLRASYPEQLIDAYINGEFVNLTAGTVYSSYDREANRSREVLAEGETVHVGMDFNVGHMAATISVMRGGSMHVVCEVIDGYDTQDVCRRLKEVLWEHDGDGWRKTRQIRVYPDASGGSRRSVNASVTDIALLKEAGFTVCAPKANPPVKDRVNSVNAAFRNAEGERKLFVNDLQCPALADALEQQPWAANGEPDKSLGIDHALDALGYSVHWIFPIIKRQVSSLSYNAMR